MSKATSLSMRVHETHSACAVYITRQVIQLGRAVLLYARDVQLNSCGFLLICDVCSRVLCDFPWIGQSDNCPRDPFRARACMCPWGPVPLPIRGTIPLPAYTTNDCQR